MTTPDTRTLLANALSEIRALRSKLRAVEEDRYEPIAITGMGCRFPGGASSPDEFWEMLARGTDTISEVPAERWGLHDTPVSPIRWGAFLDGVDQFDPMFFGISPREATAMDPQQRIFLEVAVEALERAGQPIHALEKSRTGVYVGLCNNDYLHLLLRDPAQIDTHAPTGVIGSVLSGRLSYLLGLEGPNMVLDTGCSASLVAVHLAVRGLRSRETNLAIAAGVNLIVATPSSTISAKLQAFAPDGRCKTFDARADGTVRGEGCGVVVLKRLSDAIRDRDPIRAVIRGSAVNQDGRSTSLTSPNVLSQEAVIREALADGRTTPERVGYVETHGTGTALGDPIEFEALKSTYGARRSDASRCALGAAKSNIGHLESAAGIAGLIKAVVSLERGAVPPNLHFQSLNPRISLDGTSFVLPTATGSALAWPGPTGPRTAAVSGFGIGGTNAHVVLEEAPREPFRAVTDERPTLLTLSAKTDTSLAALAQRWVDVLNASEAPAESLAASAALRRSHWERRVAVVGRTKRDLVEGLSAFADAGAARDTVGSPRVVFVFQGLGGQWPAMAHGLLAQEAVFRESMERCDAAICAISGWSVLEELHSAARFDEHAIVQPILFSIQISLAKLFASWGVLPAAVIGHSVGEIGAAHVAGALSLEDAATVICRRSELHGKLGDGGMALVATSMADAEHAIRGYEGDVVVAASNGPKTTILSGGTKSLEAIVATLERRGVFCRLVKSLGAGHSPQVDPLRDELVRRLSIDPHPSTIPFYSTVRTGVVPGEQLDPLYWGENMREPVMFGPTIERLAEDGFELFVELGPHPILAPSIDDTLRASGRTGTALPSMRRNMNERETLLRSIGVLYTAGLDIAFPPLFAIDAPCETIPTYAWDNEPYWLERTAPTAPQWEATDGHPLLASPIVLSVESAPHMFAVELDLDRTPFLRDHRVAGSVVFPGAGYLDLAWSAAVEAFGDVAAIEDVHFERLLALREGEKKRLQVVLVRRSADLADVHVSSTAEPSGFERHFRAAVRIGRRAEATPLAPAPGPSTYTAATYYEALGRIGLAFGPAFTGIAAVSASENGSVADIRVPEVIAASVGRYTAHPALLDICFQAMGAFVIGDTPAGGSGDVLLPTGIKRIVFHDRIRESSATVRARRTSAGGRR